MGPLLVEIRKGKISHEHMIFMIGSTQCDLLVLFVQMLKLHISFFLKQNFKQGKNGRGKRRGLRFY